MSKFSPPNYLTIINNNEDFHQYLNFDPHEDFHQYLGLNPPVYHNITLGSSLTLTEVSGININDNCAAPISINAGHNITLVGINSNDSGATAFYNNGPALTNIAKTIQIDNLTTSNSNYAPTSTITINTRLEKNKNTKEEKTPYEHIKLDLVGEVKITNSASLPLKKLSEVGDALDIIEFSFRPFDIILNEGVWNYSTIKSSFASANLDRLNKLAKFFTKKTSGKTELSIEDFSLNEYAAFRAYQKSNKGSGNFEIKEESIDKLILEQFFTIGGICKPTNEFFNNSVLPAELWNLIMSFVGKHYLLEINNNPAIDDIAPLGEDSNNSDL